MQCLSFLRKAVSASVSREAEVEADQMGIKIAAMSCYDTSRGAEIFRKIALLSQEAMYITSFFNSHPAPMKRYTDLKIWSEGENACSYKDCNTFSRKIAMA